MIFGLILQILIYILNKNTFFCSNLNELKQLKSNPEIKLTYQNLNKSNTHKKLKLLFNKINNPMYIEKLLIKKKDYLFAISKFVDYKINHDTKLYRAKNGTTIIENLSHVLTQKIHMGNNYSIFKTYKINYSTLSIKQKENKIFKIIVAKNLIEELIEIESELIQISNIINKYKKRKFVLNYNKNILNIARNYAILKYNPNSTYIIHRYNIAKDMCLNILFSELFDADLKLKTILSYLKVMF